MSSTTSLKQEFDDAYGPYFTYDEFKCQCNRCESERSLDMDDGDWFKTSEFSAFMLKLIDLRETLGFPFPMNSGRRCPEHNDSFYAGDGTHLDGPHTKGAGDIAIYRERMCALVNLATTRQLGIGIKQHGPLEKRFIHIDNLGFRIWTYP